MGIEKDSRDHAILYAMVRWFARYRKHNPPELAEIVPPRKLTEEEGPLRSYGKQPVSSSMTGLKDRGYVSKTTFHGKTLGYTLEEKGLEVIEELDTPQQYDH